MDLSVTFIGTSASAPSAARNTSATLIARGGARWLIDCGEGSQRQLLRSGLGLVDLDMVLVTHLHADHYLGLIGLLKTYTLRGRERALPLVGPPGLVERFALLDPVIGRLSFSLEMHEVGAAEPVWYEDGAVIRAFATHHSVSSFGYALVEDERPGQFDPAAARRLGVPEGPLFGRLQRGESVEIAPGTVVAPEGVVGPARPGRRVVVTGDTAPCVGTIDAARGADLLIHEATFLHEERRRAHTTRHSTAREAGVLAAEADVRLLALTHLSGRTPPGPARREAAEAGVEVVVPNDFDQVELPYAERGGPVVHPAAEADRPCRVAASTIATDSLGADL